jgi:YfiR/HmsC-like
LDGCRHLRGARTAETIGGGALLGVLLLSAGLWAAPGARSYAGDNAGDQAPTEYQVKAAFLLNFARFVEWPPRAFASATSPLGVCVLGEDPFGEALDRAVLGKTLSDRTLMVRRGKKLQELDGCEILFISASERGRLPEILGELRNAPVLTVGDSEEFAARGGGVQFTLEDNHVHFMVNVDATERAGLKVSSKLLSLAHVVHDEPRK